MVIGKRRNKKEKMKDPISGSESIMPNQLFIQILRKAIGQPYQITPPIDRPAIWDLAKRHHLEAMVYSTNPKRIKLLEPSIQHGEEGRVDYDPLERLVGVYNDVIHNSLLSVEEYAEGISAPVGGAALRRRAVQDRGRRGCAAQGDVREPRHGARGRRRAVREEGKARDQVAGGKGLPEG